MAKLPASSAAEHIIQLGKRGTRAAILVGPGFAGLLPAEREKLKAKIMAAARNTGVRILGRRCRVGWEGIELGGHVPAGAG